jgi:hypothetical protein
MKIAQITLEEEIRHGEEYCHWARVILHFTSSGEHGSSLAFAMQPTQSALNFLNLKDNFL